MDRITEIILIAAGIILVLLVIFFGFRAYKAANQKGEETIAKLDETYNDMLESRYTQFHGEFVSGGSVLNFIKDCENKEEGIYITVKTNKNGGGVTYVYDTSGTKIQSTTELTLIKNAKNRQHADYINPGQMFYGEVIRDASNKAIIGLIFTEEPTTP